MALPVRTQPREPRELNRLRGRFDGLLSGWDELLSRVGAFAPLADLEETDEAYLAETSFRGSSSRTCRSRWRVAA